MKTALKRILLSLLFLIVVFYTHGKHAVIAHHAHKNTHNHPSQQLIKASFGEFADADEADPSDDEDDEDGKVKYIKTEFNINFYDYISLFKYYSSLKNNLTTTSPLYLLNRALRI